MPYHRQLLQRHCAVDTVVSSQDEQLLRGRTATACNLICHANVNIDDCCCHTSALVVIVLSRLDWLVVLIFAMILKLY